MISLSRRYQFASAHVLRQPALSDADNERIYGKCANANGHGHNYVLDVTVAGAPDRETGMIIDLKVLKEILEETLIKKVDHKNLNFDVPFLQGCVPTVEMLVLRFWDELSGKLPGCRLRELTLYESDTNYARYRGPEESGNA